jgi:hypothetical protein
MAKRQVDLLQGTLDLLVLKSLALGPLHGLGVSNRIAQITKGTFQVKPGSLFPALHRMEEAGWLDRRGVSQRTIAVQSTIALPQPGGVSSMLKRRTGSAFPWRSPAP